MTSLSFIALAESFEKIRTYLQSLSVFPSSFQSDDYPSAFGCDSGTGAQPRPLNPGTISANRTPASPAVAKLKVLPPTPPNRHRNDARRPYIIHLDILRARETFRRTKLLAVFASGGDWASILQHHGHSWPTSHWSTAAPPRDWAGILNEVGMKSLEYAIRNPVGEVRRPLAFSSGQSL